ncbi:MAG: ribosomal L7Ae/L30e/S12e/Gadd45 family protein [Ruminococcus sp.]|nr:ribosomal L7Ae/L30e/S12e/Gadd45 family protein [Ruminococcus sp.]MBR2304517.1 ribosomal L7Ae/L30e/S12e/Gadd45 family protein [Ruminococcus sp.]
MKSKLGSITMCAKAGRLSIGMDMMKDACKSDNAKGVFAASDISEKSLKEVRYYCGRYGVKCFSLGMTMDELSTGLGKRTGILAVTDSGFAKSIAKGLEEISIDNEEFMD